MFELTIKPFNYLLTGPPGDISNIIIPSDTITACSFIVQWSRPYSDPMCGPVQYTVTVTTGGDIIITNTTTLTHYDVTGLNANTVYHVSVTASNNAGRSSSGTTSVSVMTNNNSKCLFYTWYVASYVIYDHDISIGNLHM